MNVKRLVVNNNFSGNAIFIQHYDRIALGMGGAGGWKKRTSYLLIILKSSVCKYKVQQTIISYVKSSLMEFRLVLANIGNGRELDRS